MARDVEEHVRTMSQREAEMLVRIRDSFNVIWAEYPDIFDVSHLLGMIVDYCWRNQIDKEELHAVVDRIWENLDATKDKRADLEAVIAGKLGKVAD